MYCIYKIQLFLLIQPPSIADLGNNHLFHDTTIFAGYTQETNICATGPILNFHLLPLMIRLQSAELLLPVGWV